MTQRSETAHRRAERRARLMNGVLNRSLTRRDAGLDKVAKAVVAKLAPAQPPDPDLDHPDTLEQPPRGPLVP